MSYMAINALIMFYQIFEPKGEGRGGVGEQSTLNFVCYLGLAPESSFYHTPKISADKYSPCFLFFKVWFLYMFLL